MKKLNNFASQYTCQNSCLYCCMSKNKLLILKRNVCAQERVALSSVAERQTQRSALLIFWNTERPVTSTMCVPFNNNSLVVNFSISQLRFLTSRALDAENLLQKVLRYLYTWCRLSSHILNCT